MSLISSRLSKFILLVIMALLGLTCDRNNENPETDPLVLKLYITDASLPGMADGSINLEISGGMGPYTIQWSTGDTTKNIDNLLPGIYTVMVRDNLDETARDTAVVGAGEPLKDIDGNTYTTVQIGIQQWMVENLRVTHTPDGDTIVSYCYDDDTSYARTFGRLYTWDVAMNGSVDESAQGICPDGYHIPSDDEWKKLEIHLGMTQSEADMENTWRGKGVGTKLGPGGTSGYEALYAGRLSPDGYYTFLNDYEYIWTSTENSKDTNYAWRRCLSKYADDVGRWNTFPKTWAFSVRCIKNN
jgi:uncharacterized protein (TIGR02145 family)